ncbi:MAG: hypothetical protein JSW52_05390 [Candidatus Coatesbacteria bacterium]|nr:MAG: hypothetical protein JSW52_05390 [Candidatus Coatesbacteria bacterium]
MRNVLLVLAVLAVAAPAVAVRTETILQQSDDTMEISWSMNNWSWAQWFDAPADCHVVSASFYCDGSGTKDVGVWDDSADRPGTLLGSVSHAFSGAWAWSPYVDLTGEGITLSSGDKFWVGIVYSAGSYPYLGLDTTSPNHGIAYSFDGSSWYFISSWDLMVRVKIDDDMDPPYVDEQDPADTTWAQPDTDIVFHCKDDDKGVDSGTIDFSADDGTRADVPGVLDIDDSDPNDVVCTFTPDSDLPEGETITCTVDELLADGLGNEMGSDAVWSFGVDGTPPTITQEYPTGGRSEGGATAKRVVSGNPSDRAAKATVYDGETRTVDPGTNIGWHIEDNASGCLFADCVYTVQVGGGDVSVAENITDDGTTDVTVELDPDSDFNPGDVVDVSVQATDIAGNTMDAAYEWSFTVGYSSVKEASLGEIKAGYH